MFAQVVLNLSILKYLPWEASVFVSLPVHRLAFVTFEVKCERLRPAGKLGGRRHQQLERGRGYVGLG